jgi:hypothetical protein
MKRLGSLLHSSTRYTKSIGLTSHAALTVFLVSIALLEGLVGALERLASENGSSSSHVHDRWLGTLGSLARATSGDIPNLRAQGL